jgi:hypothetical protein
MSATDRIRQAEQAANHIKVSADARAVALALLAVAEAVRGREARAHGYTLCPTPMCDRRGSERCDGCPIV